MWPIGSGPRGCAGVCRSPRSGCAAHRSGRALPLPLGTALRRRAPLPRSVDGESTTCLSSLRHGRRGSCRIGPVTTLAATFELVGGRSPGPTRSTCASTPRHRLSQCYLGTVCATSGRDRRPVADATSRSGLRAATSPATVAPHHAGPRRKPPAPGATSVRWCLQFLRHPAHATSAWSRLCRRGAAGMSEVRETAGLWCSIESLDAPSPTRSTCPRPAGRSTCRDGRESSDGPVPAPDSGEEVAEIRWLHGPVSVASISAVPIVSGRERPLSTPAGGSRFGAGVAGVIIQPTRGRGHRRTTNGRLRLHRWPTDLDAGPGGGVATAMRRLVRHVLHLERPSSVVVRPSTLAGAATSTPALLPWMNTSTECGISSAPAVSIPGIARAAWPAARAKWVAPPVSGRALRPLAGTFVADSVLPTGTAVLRGIRLSVTASGRT